MTTSMRTLVLTLALGALLAPGAQASSTQSSIMMDDDLLVYRDDSTAFNALTRMKALGVDTVRVTVLWKVVADKARFTPAEIKQIKRKQGRKAAAAAAAQTKRFRADKPKTYPVGNWDRFDNLVSSAKRIGIRIYFNVTGPGPAWTHETPPKALSALSATYKPKPSQFKRFVTAVGKRFSGSYVDENGCRCALPRVSFWSLWNEPNQAGWLSPQWERVGSRRVPVAPALFRRLYQFGYKGLVASGHRVDNDTILMGETAPLGSHDKGPKSPLLPGVFLRELACVRADGTKYTGAAAKARSCGDLAKYGKLQATGYAHHPYTKNVPTTERNPDPDAITMANIGDLGKLLDSLSDKTGGKIPKDLPLWMTEFGFETNPPDPFSGVALDKQASYNTLGEFIAWSNPRLASQAQFLLNDVPPVAKRPPDSKAYWFTYQSGLYFQNGSPKLSAFSYQLPFLAFRGGLDPTTQQPNWSFWGQLRFLPDGVPDQAYIQWRPQGTPDAAWTTLGPGIAIDPHGYFTAARIQPQAGGIEWRAAWLKPDATIGLVSLPSTG